jgi:hypothetical protein
MIAERGPLAIIQLCEVELFHPPVWVNDIEVVPFLVDLEGEARVLYALPWEEGHAPWRGEFELFHEGQLPLRSGVPTELYVLGIPASDDLQDFSLPWTSVFPIDAPDPQVHVWKARMGAPGPFTELPPREILRVGRPPRDALGIPPEVLLQKP